MPALVGHILRAYRWPMTLLDEAFNLAMPGQCLVCGSPALTFRWRVLCRPCVAALPDTVIRVPGPASIIETFALGPHDGNLGVLVRAAKYGRNIALIDRLGAHLGAALLGRVDVDAIVPVPIPRRRRWKRGFDQGERLARGVAASTGVEVMCLMRRRGGQTQVGKTSAERRKLPVCALSVRPGQLPNRVLLVDDVCTTGSTLHAAARALHRRGVAHIWALTVSHQEP
jgi:ComF family protein